MFHADSNAVGTLQEMLTTMQYQRNINKEKRTTAILLPARTHERPHRVANTTSVSLKTTGIAERQLRTYSA